MRRTILLLLLFNFLVYPVLNAYHHLIVSDSIEENCEQALYSTD